MKKQTPEMTHVSQEDGFVFGGNQYKSEHSDGPEKHIDIARYFDPSLQPEDALGKPMEREEDEKVFQLLEREASSLPCSTVAPQKNCVQQEDGNVSRQLLSREAFSLPCTSLAPALLGRTLCRKLPSRSILRAEVTKTKTTKNLSENFTLQTSLNVHHLYHC